MNQMPSPKHFKMQQSTPAIFIDGEAGTTGLQIRERLEGMTSVRLISIDPTKRKDPAARKEMMRQADVTVLCLHDDHAREATAMAAELGKEAPRLLDASSAHRVDTGWAYGFPELSKDMAEAIKTAQRVSNPGCYPTCAVALLRPLIEAKMIEPDTALSINALSGYSGGGRSMIEAHEAGTAPAYEAYGLGLEHKHVPEIMLYSGLTKRPIFVPAVGRFKQGMLVSIPLHLDEIKGKPTAAAIQAALEDYYKDSQYVKVISAEALKAEGGKIEPESLNGTNNLELRVYANEVRRQAVLVAKHDNLGKGASGAAVQNLKLMLGV